MKVRTHSQQRQSRVCQNRYSNTFYTVGRRAFRDQFRQNCPGLSTVPLGAFAKQAAYFTAGELSPQSQGSSKVIPWGHCISRLPSNPLCRGCISHTHNGHGLQLVHSYLDDLSLARDVAAVAIAVQQLTSAATNIGLALNAEKCEVLPSASIHNTVVRRLFPNAFISKAGGNFELLGTPIGSEEFCNNHTQDRLAKATKVVTAIGELADPQDVLLLLW